MRRRLIARPFTALIRYLHAANRTPEPHRGLSAGNQQRRDFAQELLVRWPEPPDLAAPVSQLCTAAQVREPEYLRICTSLGQHPRPHRKQWESVYTARCLEQAGMLVPGRHGLGFAFPRTKLAALFASRGCRAIVTVQPARSEAPQCQMQQRELLYSARLLDWRTFEERVAVRDFGFSGSPDLKDMDFLWSSASASHAGTLQAGVEFIERSLGWLKPGGVAVHTLEFNLESPIETVSKGSVVLFRESDLLELARRLRSFGHEVTLNLHPGAEADDLGDDSEREVQLRTRIDGLLATSAGLCIRKAAQV